MNSTNLIAKILASQKIQSSLFGGISRAAATRLASITKMPVEFIVKAQATPRPHYAYCMYNAALLAKRLGLSRISALEFGVAGGNGLAYMCAFARTVEADIGIAIDCYGFDTGQGMPDPEGAADLPYWFQAAQYKMDQEALKKRLPDAKLIIGNVNDTIDRFVDEYNPAPIGAIFNDVDYYSSTRDSFRLFDAADKNPDAFLPRIFMYFDDIIGTEWEMYGLEHGQLKAIADFNASHPDKKIHLNQNLLRDTHLRHRFQIYYGHLFNHPRYEAYIGDAQQETMESLLKLKNG